VYVPARLVIIGSGETSPTMVKLHREVLAAAGPGPAAMLDTPFGFQANADDLTDKIREYFHDSVGRSLDVATWRRRDESAVVRERSLELLGRSSWAFAGPGSPSYALRQWIDTAVPERLLDLTRRGGTLIMGSAAAVTLGAYALPVYEIYKVGDEPTWLTGLDLLGETTGIAAAVVPHFDNREGGRHDTRYCYMGEQRLTQLEALLPADVGVLGVDEHTAIIIDIDRAVVDVRGAGGLTLRHRDRVTFIPAGEQITVADVAAALSGAASPATGVRAASSEPTEAEPSIVDVPGLRSQVERRKSAFDAALARGDADSALEEALGVEEDIRAWSADTLQGDDLDYAHATLRAMVVALAGAARDGLRDERDVIGPFVDIALDARRRAREAKDFATSDAVRDALVAQRIDVRDTPDGATWERSP
jgi:cyanophycinase-like exopeptidase